MTQWFPKPAVYDRKGWHPMPYLNQGEFYSEFGTFDVKITLPQDYRIMATGDIIGGDDEYNWLDSLASVTDSINQLPEDDFRIFIKSMDDNHAVMLVREHLRNHAPKGNSIIKGIEKKNKLIWR